MLADLSIIRVRAILSGCGIPVSLQVGGLGALLILIAFSVRSAALPNALGDRADRFFVIYGFHISPRFRTIKIICFINKFHVLYDPSIPYSKLFM